jgi:hypothetical protein
MEQSGGILSKIGRSKGARVKDVRRIDLTTTPYSIFTFIKIGLSSTYRYLGEICDILIYHRF